MSELLVAGGFRLRTATRADCARCAGRSRGTVSYNAEVAHCFRCGWKANRYTLARDLGPAPSLRIYRGSSDILGGVDVAFAVSRLPARQGQAGLPARQGQMEDRDASLLKLQCFKSRFGAELALTLRPELETTGDFALADPPGVSREAADVEALRQLIAAEPGLSQREVLRRAGMAKHHTISLLRSGEGTLWQSEQGSRRSMRYYPLSSSDQEPGVTGVRQCDGP